MLRYTLPAPAKLSARDKRPLQSAMTATKSSLKFLAVLVLLWPCLGCMARRNVADPIFKLTEVDSQYFLVPNLAQTHEPHQQFQVSLSHGDTDWEHLDKESCSISGRWFSLFPIDLAGQNWTVETPSATAWAEAAGRIDMKSEWESFLQQVALLQKRGCFSLSEDFAEIKRRIVEGMAIPADESLLYRYSYGQSGYVDLTPDMQLRIERNLPANGTGRGRKNGSPLRTVVTTYSFSSAGGNDIRINLMGAKDGPGKDDSSDLKLPDKTLATTFQSSTRMRLILQRLEVSADTKSPAILLGGSENGSLDAAVESAVKDRHLSCRELGTPQVTCVQFDGLVTVSPVLRVKVNGRWKYAPLGSKLPYVFPLGVDASKASIMKDLRVRRRFDGKYIDLQFGRNEQDVGQVLLFGGDEISWSKSGRS